MLEQLDGGDRAVDDHRQDADEDDAYLERKETSESAL